LFPDRKKDLVKLRGGEYVSLTKVEMAVGKTAFIDNCCLCASSSAEYTVILVCPNPKQMAVRLRRSSSTLPSFTRSLVRSKAYTDKHFGNPDWQKLLNNTELNEQVLKDIQEACRKGGIERFETPQRAQVVGEPWTPETGLVTDALKLKRKAIEQKYRDQIDDLYLDKPKKNSSNVKLSRVVPMVVSPSNTNERRADASANGDTKKDE
jgi:long-chain acyl-CoA synthetase